MIESERKAVLCKPIREKVYCLDILSGDTADQSGSVTQQERLEKFSSLIKGKVTTTT